MARDTSAGDPDDFTDEDWAILAMKMALDDYHDGKLTLWSDPDRFASVAAFLDDYEELVDRPGPMDSVARAPLLAALPRWTPPRPAPGRR